MTITGEYDATVLVNETFLNKAIRAVFSTFPQIDMSMDALPLNIRIEDIVSNASQFPQIRMSINALNIDLIGYLLEPPLIIIRSDKDAEVVFKLGIRPSTDLIKEEAVVGGSLQMTMSYDQITGKFIVEVRDIDIDQIELGDFLRIPYFLIAPVTRALSFALKKDLFRRLSRISISPSIPPIPLPIDMLTEHLGDSLPISGLELGSNSPDKEEPTLPLKIAGGGFFRRGVAYGVVNFLDHATGDSTNIVAPDDGADLQIAISSTAIQSLVQYIWPYLPQRISRTSRVDVPDYRTMMDAMVGVFDAVRTFGVSRRKVRVNRSWVDHGAVIGYGLPQLRLKDGGKIEIASCPLSVDAWASPKMEGMADLGTRRQSFKNFMRPGRETTEPQPKPETITMFEYTHHMDLVLHEAIIEIGIGQDNLLTGKLSNINLAIELPWKLPKQVLDSITNWLINQIVKNFPALSILSMGIPDNILPGPLASFSPLIKTVKIERIESDESELTISASMP